MRSSTQHHSGRVLTRTVVPATLIILALLAWLWLMSPLRATGAQPDDGSATPDLTTTPTWRVDLVIASSFGANMLECASVGCELVAFLDYGTELELVETEVGWYHVRTADGHTGYVPDFLVATPTEEAAPTLAPQQPGFVQPAPQPGVVVPANPQPSAPSAVVPVNTVVPIPPGESQIVVPRNTASPIVIPPNLPATPGRVITLVAPVLPIAPPVIVPVNPPATPAPTLGLRLPLDPRIPFRVTLVAPFNPPATAIH